MIPDASYSSVNSVEGAIDSSSSNYQELEPYRRSRMTASISYSIVHAKRHEQMTNETKLDLRHGESRWLMPSHGRPLALRNKGRRCEGGHGRRRHEERSSHGTCDFHVCSWTM